MPSMNGTVIIALGGPFVSYVDPEGTVEFSTGGVRE